MSRKTINVRELLDRVNRRNAESTVAPGLRAGWNALLEEVLRSTGNQAGYAYLEQDKVPADQLPGVIRDAAGNCVSFPDDSRRFYYAHHKLYAVHRLAK